jgi:hypothetical protein
MDVSPLWPALDAPELSNEVDRSVAEGRCRSIGQRRLAPFDAAPIEISGSITVRPPQRRPLP